MLSLTMHSTLGTQHKRKTQTPSHTRHDATFPKLPKAVHVSSRHTYSKSTIAPSTILVHHVRTVNPRNGNGHPKHGDSPPMAPICTRICTLLKRLLPLAKKPATMTYMGRQENDLCCSCHAEPKASNRSYCRSCWNRRERERRAQRRLARIEAKVAPDITPEQAAA